MPPNVLQQLADMLAAREEKGLGVYGASVRDFDWQKVPEGQRIGMLARVLGVKPTEAARAMASMAFARNEAHAVPGSYQTRLNPEQEQEFSKWAVDNDLFNPQSRFPDYDMRGWWLAMKSHDPKATYNMQPAQGAKGQFLRILFPETFVTPYSLDFNPNSEYWKRQK